MGDERSAVGLARLIIKKEIDGATYSDAFRYLEVVKKNKEEADYLWGLVFRDGLGKNKDLKLAKEYFQKCANAGSSECAKELFFTVPPDDPKERIIALRRCAEPGDSDCQFALYKELQSIQDPEAKGWLKRAVDAGHSKGQIEYGKVLQDKQENNKASHYYGLVLANPDASPEDKEIADNYIRLIRWRYQDGEELVDAGDCFGALRIWKGLSSNSPESAFKLGEIYEEGSCDIDKDISMSRMYYRSAHEQGHKMALTRCAETNDSNCQFALYKEIGIGDWLRKSADAGHPKAQIEYALRLKTSNNKKANNYLEMLLTNNSATLDQKKIAKNLLSTIVWTFQDGVSYFDEGECASAISIWKDLSTKYYSAESSYRLGEIFEAGTCNITRDLSAARVYYELALEQGHKNPFISLCRVYVGEAVTNNNESANVKAFKYCSKCVDQEKTGKNKKYCRNLLEDVMPPVKLAEKLIAEKQCKEAQGLIANVIELSKNSDELFFAGKFYLDMMHCNNFDASRANLLLGNAYDGGEKGASLYLGIINYHGLIRDSSMSLAKHYFDVAKDNGLAEAYYYLGIMAESPSDKVELFKKGAQLGDPGSKLKLAEKYNAGDVVWRDSDKAIALIRESVAMKYPDAYYYLARAYQEGWGDLGKDSSLHLQYCRKAADLGSVLGMFCLCVDAKSIGSCRTLIKDPYANQTLIKRARMVIDGK